MASLLNRYMLRYLHLCSDAGIIVTDYIDDAVGTMNENPDGSGEFTEVVLRPQVALADEARHPEADTLHHKAHSLCFIAKSVKCEVRCEPVQQPPVTRSA